MTIPKRYYKAGNHPKAETVGELKKLLAELPDDLPVHHTWGAGPELIVYNHGRPDMHLEFTEPDDADND